jgi:predicted neutral ceramidase superfamily lipid hydrolase
VLTRASPTARQRARDQGDVLVRESYTVLCHIAYGTIDSLGGANMPRCTAEAFSLKMVVSMVWHSAQSVYRNSS